MNELTHPLTVALGNIRPYVQQQLGRADELAAIRIRPIAWCVNRRELDYLMCQVWSTA